jgi:hypothetical protein
MLPAGTRQGKPAWWVAAANLQVEMDPASHSGEAIIALKSSGQAWAQVELFDHQGTTVRYSWNTLDLFQGYAVSQGSGPVIRAGVLNFPARNALHGGRNRLTLQIQQLGLIRVRRIRLIAGGYERTRLVPDPIRVRLRIPSAVLHVGDRAVFRYTIANLNPFPQRNVRLSVDVAGVGLRTRPRPIPVLRKKVSGTLRVSVLKAGRFTVRLAAASEVTQGAATLQGQSLPRERSRAWALGWSFGVALLMVCGFEGVRRAKRRAPKC